MCIDESFSREKYFQRIRRGFIILFLHENPCKNKTTAFLRIQNVPRFGTGSWQTGEPDVVSLLPSSAPVSAWLSSQAPRLPQHPCQPGAARSPCICLNTCLLFLQFKAALHSRFCFFMTSPTSPPLHSLL